MFVMFILSDMQKRKHFFVGLGHLSILNDEFFSRLQKVSSRKKFEPTNRKIPKKLCMYESLVYIILNRGFDFYGNITCTEIISCVITVIISSRCVVTDSDLFHFKLNIKMLAWFPIITDLSSVCSQEFLTA